MKEELSVRRLSRSLIIVLLSVFSAIISVHGQSLRYFEMQQSVSDDTVFFVVATSLPDVIAQVEQDLAAPVNQRRFISGNVVSGDGGFNFDRTVWCNWHFVINEWVLTSANVEYCDGTSSGIGNNPALANGDTIYFCPWTSCVNREVQLSELSLKSQNDLEISVYPNPASELITIDVPVSCDLSKITVLNLAGEPLVNLPGAGSPFFLDVRGLPVGCYLVELTTSSGLVRKKIVVAEKK